ncbi:SRPBCC family protein [Proteobacteria bacterium 005FR1]|nr:SRPBCC family protein [Proteobacteria bacterium 005FR1]
MMGQQFFHEITIACDTETVFDYVTDPVHWHEWFSSSLPDKRELNPQLAGEQFRVQTMQRPLSLLPLALSHSVVCTVCKCDRPYLWEVTAESPLVEAITSYSLSRSEEGTILKRQFRYTPRRWLRYAEPALFRRRVRQQARESLSRLKAALEKRC